MLLVFNSELEFSQHIVTAYSNVHFRLSKASGQSRDHDVWLNSLPFSSPQFFPGGTCKLCRILPGVGAGAGAGVDATGAGVGLMGLGGGGVAAPEGAMRNPEVPFGQFTLKYRQEKELVADKASATPVAA